MRHHYRPLIIVAATALMLSSCASEEADGTAAASADDGGGGDEHQIGHVHGLGINPADGTLYAAAHLGVFQIGEDGVPVRIADRWQDTMAFTVTGPNTFLASGHPDMREKLPPHLGLIESTDAAETWDALSLQGEADFHALEVVGDRVFGYESTGGRILTTTDRSTWKTVTAGQFIDLASVAASTDRILATTGEGRVVEITLTGQSRSFDDAPRLAWIDATPGGELVGVGPGGEIYSTDDAGGEWTRRGAVDGQPSALDTSEAVWHVATDSGIYASTDRGSSWTSVVELEH